MTVVGVIDNVLTERLEQTPDPVLYRPMTQSTNLSFAIAVRASGDPHRLAPAVVRSIRAADPNVPAFAVRTMDEVQGTAVAARRFTMQLLGGFAALALLLAAIGIYGVLAYLVHQRTREIGIRIALGARPIAVMRMVMSHALTLALAGIAAGAVAALAVGRLMQRAAAGLLFNVGPSDPLTFAVVTTLLVATAILAASVPARRATQVDPMVALRAD
jgi:ABC-type antimicrobial peptide transport system permease subunit